MFLCISFLKSKIKPLWNRIKIISFRVARRVDQILDSACRSRSISGEGVWLRYITNTGVKGVKTNLADTHLHVNTFVPPREIFFFFCAPLLSLNCKGKATQKILKYQQRAPFHECTNADNKSDNIIQSRRRRRIQCFGCFVQGGKEFGKHHGCVFRIKSQQNTFQKNK